MLCYTIQNSLHPLQLLDRNLLLQQIIQKQPKAQGNLQSNPINSQKHGTSITSQGESKLTILSPRKQFLNNNNVGNHPFTVQNNPAGQEERNSTTSQKSGFNFNFSKSSKNGVSQLTTKSGQPSQNLISGTVQNTAASYPASRTTNTSPVVKQMEKMQSTSPMIHHSPSPQVASSQKVSPIRTVSPGEKIVIKKSEIKFKHSNSSLNEYDSNNDRYKESNTSPPVIHAAYNDISQNKTTADSTNGGQGKQLAFDFIKNMLGFNSNANSHTQQLQDQLQNSEKDEMGATLKKKFVKFGSPGFNHKVLKKQNVNFVLDMKKHGIQKDIESVKAMRYYLENSPVQSENTSIIDISQSPNDVVLLKKAQSCQQGDPKSYSALDQNPPTQSTQQMLLEIETNYKPEEKQAFDEKKISPSNEQNYIFPFQRRARSHSPPKDVNLGDNSQNSQTSIQNESPPGVIVGGTGFKFPGDQNVASKLQIQGTGQNSKIHQRTNSGPIIPDRNCIENVIRNTPGIFFGMGPHLGKNYEERQEQIYQELEHKILKGQEVDDWAQEEENKRESASKRQSVLNKVGGMQQSQINNQFQQNGFIGDADDVEDDDGDGDQDSNDWMFQTFEKKNQNAMKSKGLNEHKMKNNKVGNIGKNDLDQNDFEDELNIYDEDESINQFGTDNGGTATTGGGFTNMLDKWMNQM
ncbi:UNKNOWN [Stylonychia lemnae]|uniref:Uncharacterized protein n=1 Tax=Stylonychia lemnae TaxID=5949 RepID=A0A078B522_STYLE|nr:UNKNOWN [Stylonychia lemnae]|eukprot:CDW89519.1 UNKNOWN [Stylonychia lemnae]